MNRTTLASVIAVLLLVCSSSSRAEQDEPGIDLQRPTTGESTPAVRLSTSPALRSENVASGLALGSTLGGLAVGVALCPFNPLAGMAVAVLSVGIGPAIGHAYAGEWGHAALTSLGRLALGGGGYTLFVIGLVVEALSGEGESTPRHSSAGIAMMASGVALGLGAAALAIYDIVDAPGAARRANRRRPAALAVAPLVGPTSDGGMQYGVAVAMRF